MHSTRPSLSVNSALQRARSTIDERLPEQSQQVTLRALGDERMNQIVQDYMTAMERGDVDRVVSMLSEEAAWSMPPLATWYAGLPAIRDFLHVGPLSGKWRWRHLPTRANGQPAVGCYTWRADDGSFRPFALDVLTLDGDRIGEICSFIVRGTEGLDAEAVANYPDEPPDPVKVQRSSRTSACPPGWTER